MVADGDRHGVAAQVLDVSPHFEGALAEPDEMPVLTLREHEVAKILGVLVIAADPYLKITIARF